MTHATESDAAARARVQSEVLWLVLGRAVTVAMLPWMIWVSVTIVSMQREIAILGVRVQPEVARLLAALDDVARDNQRRITMLEAHEDAATP